MTRSPDFEPGTHDLAVHRFPLTRYRWITALCFMLLLGTVSAKEHVDYQVLEKIREEGSARSQVMEHISWLADVYGPRVTGTPAIKQAADWTMKKAKEWGLSNVHLEKFPFEAGWSVVRFSAHMVEPQIQPLIGYPMSWTPGTGGTRSADVIFAPIQSEKDFERYRGKLRGKIVLAQPEREVRMLEGRLVLEMSDADIEEARSFPIPSDRATQKDEARAGLKKKIRAFFLSEGVVAVLDRGRNSDTIAGGSGLSWKTQRADGGTVFVGKGGSHEGDPDEAPPSVTLAVEHYNRMVRVLKKGIPVKVELDIQTRWHDQDGFNIIAEIRGTDLAREIVMIGAHFDSTHAGTGATDNACGSATIMEAMRILQTVGARPRRTIRMALWGGEEQGLLGSSAYVREHFGDSETMKLKEAHESFSGYFNVDNGTGRVRGIWAQANVGVMAIFDEWMEPLRNLGMTILAPRAVFGSDHLAFDRVGLPGFQFLQERLEYNSRTHHSNMDVFDRVQGEDMIQAATVVAIFAYNAAMQDEKLPRKALPRSDG